MTLYTIKVKYFNSVSGKVENLTYITQNEGDYKYKLITMLTNKDYFVGSIKIEDEVI